MRIIHLSDLHFGTEIPELVKSLDLHIRETPADFMIVSGDFTQIGSREEFILARNFINSFDIPVLCVPGNHDIPRFDMTERLLNPYSKYRQYICDDLTPVFQSDHVCIAGINTARRILPHWNWAHGAISKAQTDRLHTIYEQSKAPIRLCVMHHPLHKVKDQHFKTIVYGGDRALEEIKKMKVDLVLTGHVHHASATTIEYEGHRTIFLSASTALSRRLRQSANGYNVITIQEETLKIEMFTYKDNSFSPLETITHDLSAVFSS